MEVAFYSWINNTLGGEAAGRGLWKNSSGSLGIEQKKKKYTTKNKYLLNNKLNFGKLDLKSHQIQIVYACMLFFF